MKISADLGKSWNTAQLPTITGDRVRKGIKVLKVLIADDKDIKVLYVYL